MYLPTYAVLAQKKRKKKKGREVGHFRSLKRSNSWEVEMLPLIRM
jgi:hypothetical protein